MLRWSKLIETGFIMWKVDLGAEPWTRPLWFTTLVGNVRTTYSIPLLPCSLALLKVRCRIGSNVVACDWAGLKQDRKHWLFPKPSWYGVVRTHLTLTNVTLFFRKFY